jgi:CHASE2 domain-containing sensor protein
MRAEREDAVETPTQRSSPYQGLVPYSEADQEWFFGREEWGEIVVDNLRAYRVSVLYGESGVGKSSLLRASVLPQLHAESRRNLAEAHTPGAVAVVFAEWSLADPLSALKEAIRKAVAELAPDLGDKPPEGPLAEVLAGWSERLHGTLFVVLDQFEELFLYHSGAETGFAFEEELATALRRRDNAANVLISIREDTLAKVDRLQSRVPGLLDNLFRLDHLDTKGARQAIERPLKRWNGLHRTEVAIEPTLVEEVLAQVEAGRLLISGSGGAGRVQVAGGPTRIEAPYLQLVLSRIWYEESAAGSRILRLETLERLGGAEKIVRTHLDQVLATLSWRDRGVAARVFRYLVTPSGTKIAHRPRDLAEYADVDEKRLMQVLAALAGEARILRPVADGAYEIYHDVLTAAVLDWRRRFEENRSQGILARGIVLSAAAALVAILMVAYLGQVLDRWEVRTVDTRFSIRGARAPDDVALVSIDEKTFNALRLAWPFPRSLHGRLIDRLRRDGARAIAYNIQFIGSTTPREDAALAAAVARARNVALAATEIDTDGRTQVLGGDDILRELHARPGDANLEVSSGGVIRRLRWGTSGGLKRRNGQPGPKLENLALVAVEIANKRRIRPAALGGSTDIDYAGPPGTIPSFSFSDVLKGQVPRDAFRGRVVVVGATAPSLQDLHPTPDGRLMSGAEIQANAIDTALRGFPLHPQTALDLILIAVLGLIVPVASLRVGSRAVVFLSVVTGGLYTVALQLAFNHDILLPALYPLLALVLTTALVLGLRFRSAHGRRANMVRTQA